MKLWNYEQMTSGRLFFGRDICHLGWSYRKMRPNSSRFLENGEKSCKILSFWFGAQKPTFAPQ